MLTEALEVNTHYSGIIIDSLNFFNRKLMGYLYTFLTSIILLFNTTDIPYSNLEVAFSENNPNTISALGKDKILINILGTEGAYSQSQATLVLKDFFIKKPGDSFKFVFKGKETVEGCFAIGNYTCKSETFRITIQFKKISSDYKIESLTIEKS